VTDDISVCFEHALCGGVRADYLPLMKVEEPFKSLLHRAFTPKPNK
jgi:hypothetical protein